MHDFEVGTDSEKVGPIKPVAAPRLLSRLPLGGLLTIALTVAGLSLLEPRLTRAGSDARQFARIAGDARQLALDEEKKMRVGLATGPIAGLAALASSSIPTDIKLDSLVELSMDEPVVREQAMTIRITLERWRRRTFLTMTNIAADALSQRDPPGPEGEELFYGVKGSFDAFLETQERRIGKSIRLALLVQRIGLAMIMLQILLMTSIVAVMIRRSAAQKRQLTENQARLVDQAIELGDQANQLDNQAGKLIEQEVQLQVQSGAALTTLERLAVSNKDLAFNITELRLARANFAEANASTEQVQALLDTFLTCSPVGFAMLDRDLRYTLVNEAMAAICGLPPDDVIGKTPADISSPNLARETEHLMREVIRTRTPISNVEQHGSLLFRDDDEECHWLVSYFPVGQKGAKVLGVGLVATETTTNRRLKEKLIEAQKLEAVGRLAAGVAHDFNNMLTAIKSYSELVLDDLDPESSQHADVIEISKATDRAITLTRQLLAFSSEQVMQPKLMDLNATVRGIEGMLRPVVGASVQLDTSLAADLARVTADRAEIERVIMNLVINARDAMPNGGKLRVETSNVRLDEAFVMGRSEAPPGEYVMLAVTDTGTGMTKGVRDRMFEPFFSTKERGKGTGLGLSSAYGVIKQLNGYIDVQSEVGRGTTVRICLPRAEKSGGNSEMYRQPQRDRATVLLVEDDESVRAVAARILTRQRFAVIEACDGREALAICDTNGFDLDLVVTDIEMPHMNGVELALRIRAVRPGTRVLFTSGSGGGTALPRSLEASAVFLEKPFSVEGLARKATEMLNMTCLEPAA